MWLSSKKINSFAIFITIIFILTIITVATVREYWTKSSLKLTLGLLLHDYCLCDSVCCIIFPVSDYFYLVSTYEYISLTPVCMQKDNKPLISRDDIIKTLLLAGARGRVIIFTRERERMDREMKVFLILNGKIRSFVECNKENSKRGIH